MGGRYNARGFDLNRNFPDYFKQNNKRSQPETEAVKEWISKIQFVLSGNIHGGALVSSYPFDNTPNSIFSSVLSSPSLTPDDDTFKHLAATYSLNHGRMYLGDPCKVGAPQFPNGTTNGAAWYPLTGGMQEYKNNKCAFTIFGKNSIFFSCFFFLKNLLPFYFSILEKFKIKKFCSPLIINSRLLFFISY